LLKEAAKPGKLSTNGFLIHRSLGAAAVATEFLVTLRSKSRRGTASELSQKRGSERGALAWRRRWASRRKLSEVGL